MTVTSILRDPPNNVCIVRMTVDGDLSQVTEAEYVIKQAQVIKNIVKGDWRWFYSDVVLVSADDTTGFFQFSNPELTTLIPISEAVFPVGSTQSVYVSPEGSDLTGNGSILSPYQTIVHALSQITDASSSKLYLINCLYGVYNEGSLQLKPYVSVNGQGSILNVIGSITADPIWIDGGNLQFGNFSNVSVSISLNFDLSSVSAPCIVQFYKMAFSPSSSILVFGKDENLILILSELYSLAGSLNIYVQDAYGAITNSSALNLTYLATSLSSGYNFQVAQTYVFDTCDFSSSPGAVGVNSVFTGSKLLNALNVSGANTNLLIDTSSLTSSSLPNITLGANVQYINVSNTLTANYSPSNYTPNSSGTSPITSVAAHLHGIDDKFGSLSSVITNDIYVSNQGNDGTGNGTLDNPYQTISFAISQITTNSSTNYFKIICTQGIYTETSLIFKPYVFVDGRNSLLTVDSVELESNFIDGGDLIFENFFRFTCTGGTLKFDAGSSTQPVILIINNLLSEVGFDINITGSNSSAYTYLYLNSVQTTIGTINFNITDCAGEINNCFGKNYEYTALNPSVSFYFSQKNNYFFGGVNVINSGGSGVQSAWNSNKIDGAFNASGSLSILLDSNTSSSSSVPSLSGGATITYLNVADTLSANFSPSNYTPVDSSVKGNFQGIDNKFSTFAGSYSTVSPAITASTGFGSILLSRSVSQRVGDTVSITAYYVGNPSATTCDFTISVPFMSGNFPDGLQCVGNGTFYRLAGASLVNMGAVLEIVSLTGTQTVRVNSLSQATGVSHVIVVNFSYKIT